MASDRKTPRQVVEPEIPEDLDEDWIPDPATSAELDRLAAAIGPVLREATPLPVSETQVASERLTLLLNRLKRLSSEPISLLDSEPFESEVVNEYEPPEVIGNYRLIRFYARGGMGVVYLAKHRFLDHFAAVKLIRPERLASPNARKRFTKENLVNGKLNSLQHPSLIKAYDADYVNNVPYLATEFVHGLTISEVLARSGPCDVSVATEVIRQVAEGLSLTHAAGLIHRDIKPSNIMLTADGTARILDFGLALWDDDENSAAEISESDQIVGTLDYMAPEQLRRSRAASNCSDIYSLGATLFRMLTGKFPLPTEATNSRAERIVILLEGERRSLSEQCQEVPAELATLVDRMLSSEIATRPQSAADVARALEPFASRPALAQFASEVIPPPSEEIPAAQLMSEPSPVGVKPTMVGSKPKLRLWKLIGLLIVLCGLAVANVANRNKPDSVVPKIDHSADPLIAANTEPRESTSDEQPRATSEPPVVVNWNPDEFASAGLADVPEPPSLDEWLIGKKIITVKQDGTAQHRTIFSACRACQPGDVVEVLDVGPYVENLKIMPMPAGSGLISRVGTVVVPAQWNGKKQLHKSVNLEVLTFSMHSLAQCPDFRLSGFNFHWESIHNSRPFDMFTDGEFVIENCAFLQTGSTVHANGNRPPLMWLHQTPSDSSRPSRIVVRDCVFSSTLRVQLADPDPTTLLVTRNLFRSADSAMRLWLFLDNTNAREHQLLIRENVFHAKDFTTLVGPPMTPAQVVFDRNTLLSQAGFPALQINASDAEPNNTHMTIARNAVFGPPNTWLTSPVKNANPVRFNLVPAPHPDHELSPQFVTRFLPSLIVEQPEYMRLTTDSTVGRAFEVAGSITVPGALAMHEPGRADDWFDRLRLRWVEQMKLNEQLAEQLRAVPRQ